ncbi:hypothetical protein BH11MYX1_BH11MYX1_35630 [soil metagenome]
MSSKLSVVVLATALSVAGCGKKSSSSGPAPDVTGLSAIPASAVAVIAIDVPRVLGAPLVGHAIDVLLQRDPVLAERWNQLHDSCKLDPKQFRHIAIAMGPHTGPQPGTGPVLVVATGTLVETELAACIRTMVGNGSGSLTASPLGNRTLYQAKDGTHTMFFAFGRPDTVVMSANEAFVTEALGAGKKLPDNPEMAKWIAMADQKAPIWAAGRVDERVGQGLVNATGGQLSAGPTAMIVAVDLTKGAKLELGGVMVSPADAKALESFAKTQLGGLAMAAQAVSLGALVAKVQITADASVVRLSAALDSDEVNQLVSVLDGGKGSAQSAPPPDGSAGSAGSSGP